MDIFLKFQSISFGTLNDDLDSSSCHMFNITEIEIERKSRKLVVEKFFFRIGCFQKLLALSALPVYQNSDARNKTNDFSKLYTSTVK